MGAMASQITTLTIIYSTVYSDVNQRKHESSASLAFVWGIHRGPVNSPHKWPVTQKMFPFDDVIMYTVHCSLLLRSAMQHCSTEQYYVIKFITMRFNTKDRTMLCLLPEYWINQLLLYIWLYIYIYIWIYIYICIYMYIDSSSAAYTETSYRKKCIKNN